MSNFLINSAIASIALTALINVIPRLFPGSSAEDRVRDLVGEERPSQFDTPAQGDTTDDAARPAFRIWFPWKQMLLWSMVITIAINVIQLLD